LSYAPPPAVECFYAKLGVELGGLWALASVVLFAHLGIPLLVALIFPAIGYLIGTYLDQRPAH
jgi:hypothetical protein